MRYAMIAAIVVAGMTTLPIVAQAESAGTNARRGSQMGISKSGERSGQASTIVAVASQWNVSTMLPSPRIGNKAETGDYLKCAYAALAMGRDGLAQQSLEMAETRALGGVMPKGGTVVPGDLPKVFRIRDALRALGGGDRKQAIQFIKIAMLN